MRVTPCGEAFVVLTDESLELLVGALVERGMEGGFLLLPVDEEYERRGSIIEGAAPGRPAWGKGPPSDRAFMRDSRTLVSFFESSFMPRARPLGVNGFSVGPPLGNTHSCLFR